MVDRRCAITRLVRPCISRSSASCTASLRFGNRAPRWLRRGSGSARPCRSRAIASARWPPELAAVVADLAVEPCGSRRRNRAGCASQQGGAHARSRSSAPASATLAAMVSLNSTTSWLTSANWRRSASARPSRAAPCRPAAAAGARLGKRGSRLISVVLPAPKPTSATVSPGAAPRQPSSAAVEASREGQLTACQRHPRRGNAGACAAAGLARQSSTSRRRAPAPPCRA